MRSQIKLPRPRLVGQQAKQATQSDTSQLHPLQLCTTAVHHWTDMIFVKSFTQARFQPIWKFTPITRKPRHVLPRKTPYKSKQMCDSPTVLLRYALSLLYNIKLIKNYTKIFKITQDMSSPAEILPNIEIIYTSAACDACDKYHVWLCTGCVDCTGCLFLTNEIVTRRQRCH